MSEYLAKDIGLGIQGVAIKSGALKKLEDDREAFMDVMKRSAPPGVKTHLKPRTEMPSGFRMSAKPGAGLGPSDLDLQSLPRGPNLLNPMSKEEIFWRMGIDGSKELEVDWEQADMYGRPKTRVELADKMYDVLHKEKQRLEHRKTILESRRQADLSPLPPEQSAPLQTHVHPSSSQPRPALLRQPHLHSRGSFDPAQTQFGQSQRTPHDSGFFDSQERNELPWTHISRDRMNYASNYGLGVRNRLPYEDEVDMVHEDPDRFQEVNHWYSTLEKPNEDNLNVLRKLNEEKLEQLGQLYQQQKLMEQMASYRPEEPEMQRSKREELKKSNREVNKERQDYKDKFKRYLHNKERPRSKTPSPDSRGVSRPDFDRYQCTSPNPKYITKPNVVAYKDLM